MILHRKFKPTSLFTGTVMLPPGQVLITSANGTIIDMVHETHAGDDVETLDGILCPGFINAHCHIELSHMKGVIPEHTGLVEFVKQVILQRETRMPAATAEEQFEKLPDLKHRAMSQAAQELWQGGTVAIGDICNTTDSLELKANSKLHWHNFIEVSGFVDAVAQKRLAAAEDIRSSFQQRKAGSGHTLSPHSPYSVSGNLFRLLNDRTAGDIISIHNQETAAENELYLQKKGPFLALYKDLNIILESFQPTAKSSLQSWLPYFNKRQRIIAVHNTFINEQDLHFINALPGRQELSFCLCVNANLYIENKLPPIEMLLRNDCKVVLGTDSYASNNQLNMLAEIKSVRTHFPNLEPGVILQWATLNGAQALGIDDKFGSFEKGKKPGLVLIHNNFESSRLIV